MRLDAVGTDKRNVGAHRAEVLGRAGTDGGPGHLTQLTAHQLEGYALGLGELNCNMQCVGDDDAVVAGLKAEVLGADVVGENLDGGTRVQHDGTRLRIA